MNIHKSIVIGSVQVLVAVIISLIILLYSLDSCPKGSFSCDNDTVCVLQKSVCDSRVDCLDKSDEGPLNCGMWYGSTSVINNIMSGAIDRNSSELEKLFRQQSNESGSGCLLPQYENPKWQCDRLLMDCIKCGLLLLPGDLPNNVEQLILSDNNIELSEDMFFNYKHLKYIVLRKNRITNLPGHLFKYQIKLKRLYLNENLITSIPPNLFKKTGLIEWLFLDDNNISDLNITIFSSLNNLKWLELQHNSLTLVDQAFPTLNSLTEMDLSYNCIQSVSEHLFKNLGHLERLWLGHNQISYLHSKAFKNLVNMKDLELSHNPINHLEYMLNSMEKLDALYLDYTNIKITKNVLENVNVSYLNLEGIKTINIDFDTLNQMKRLTYIVYDNIYNCFMTPKIYRCKPNNDGVSSLTHLLQKPVLRYSAWIITFLILFGNTSVIWKRSLLRDENRAVSVVIRNLAVSDLLMGLYLAIICVEDYYTGSNYQEVAHSWMTSNLCIAAGILAMISSETSILILSFMSIERFLLISNPFGQYRLTHKNVVKCMFSIWLIGIKLAILPAIRLRTSSSFYGHHSGICFPLLINDPYFVGWEWSATIFLVINSTLLLLITSLYSALLINIFQTRMATQSLIYDYEFVVRFFFIVITDALCWAPITYFKAMSYISNYQFSSDIQAWIVVFILPLNSAVNPFLYTFTTPKYREQMLSRRKLSKGSDKNIRTKESNPDESQAKFVPLGVSSIS